MKMGDVGKIDKDGNMYITGRIKDIIVLRNAKKINASQVCFYLTLSYDKTHISDMISLKS